MVTAAENVKEEIDDKHDLTRRKIDLTEWILETAKFKKVTDTYIRLQLLRYMKKQGEFSMPLLCLIERAQIGDNRKIRLLYVERMNAFFTEQLGREVKIKPNGLDLDAFFM
jgi:hypothetical protein